MILSTCAYFLLLMLIGVTSEPVETTPTIINTNNRTGRLLENITSSTPPTPVAPCASPKNNGGVLPNVIFPKCTASLNPESLRNMIVHGMACACDLSTLGVPAKRDDYRYTPGLGGHKFHTRAATFNDARKICNEEGGHLAVIDSLAEEQVSRHFCFTIYVYPMRIIFLNYNN